MIEGERKANTKALRDREARSVDGRQLVEVGALEVLPGKVEIAQLAREIFTVRGS